MKKCLIIFGVAACMLCFAGCATVNGTTKVQLFYYNIEKDRAIAEYIPCSPDAVLPVEREILKTDTPIEDTMTLLLQGKLTEEEKMQGFRTEFPHALFTLEDANLENGTLTLKFSDPDGFTIGGSCRVGLLASQIEKTALQFASVKEVQFEPDTLFQP